MTSEKQLHRATTLQPDQDSRDLFAQLMKDAEHGSIVGAVVVLIHPKGAPQKKQYTISLSGRAETNPTYAMGAVISCLTILRNLALKQAGLK